MYPSDKRPRTYASGASKRLVKKQKLENAIKIPQRCLAILLLIRRPYNLNLMVNKNQQVSKLENLYVMIWLKVEIFCTYFCLQSFYDPSVSCTFYMWCSDVTELNIMTSLPIWPYWLGHVVTDHWSAARYIKKCVFEPSLPEGYRSTCHLAHSLCTRLPVSHPLAVCVTIDLEPCVFSNFFLLDSGTGRTDEKNNATGIQGGTKK